MRVAILLAAGRSQRFGAANKLFARYRGRTLLAHAIAIARRAPAQRLIVVTGAQRTRVADAVHRIAPQARLVHAQGHREGVGASLRAAAHALRPIDREVFVFLADMPWLPAEMAGRLARSGPRGTGVVRPVCRGRPGHPVLLRGRALVMLAEARGDEGPGRRGDTRVALLQADRRCVADVDHLIALRRTPPRLR